MVSPQDSKSGMRRGVNLMTSTRAGKDDFGVRSCLAFAISAVLSWLLIIFEYLVHGYNGGNQIVLTIGLLLTIGWFLTICSAVLLGVVFAVAGIGRAIRERRVPILSIIGIILNVAPSGFLFLVLFVRA